MAPATPRLRILSVGGNAVSAFLSWRLQATNACDVTLVWKSGYDTVAQYGISIKSHQLGVERFKPYAVVRTPEEATQASKIPFDYVVLCVKALPDIYDLATIIESVVTPQHTCILLNTTNSIGIEEYLEERYSTNVVLSLVCGADLTQLGPTEFEHKGTTSSMWVGWANQNANIPEAIQKDMAEALAMTLSTAMVECLVSLNIRQQQMEKMIGPIAFHPTSVIFNNSNLSQLYESPGVSAMINGIVDELVQLARGLGCDMPDDFRDKVITTMKKPPAAGESTSVMFQDSVSRRPMEIETFLGSPLRLAKKIGLTLPRLEVVYALLHDRNQKNLKGESPPSPGAQQSLPPRTSSMPINGPGSRPPTNGIKPRAMGSRAPSLTGPPPMAKRAPQPNGYRPQNGSMGNGLGPYANRRDSTDEANLDEFSHLVLYENVADGGFQDGSSGSFGDGGTATPSSSELALRERELALREKEIMLREREANMHSMRRGGGGPPPRQQQRRPPPGQLYDDDDDEDDFFDPMGGARPNGPGEDNIDMMSITSRRHRKAPSSHGNFDHAPPPPQQRGRGGKNMFNRKNRSSTRLMQDMPSPHDAIMNNPLLGYSSNRYGTVDRQALEQESRHNSMTGARMEEMARAAQSGQYPGRRISHSPGNPLSPAPRHSPPNGVSNGMRPGPPHMANGRPSPPGVRQSMPRHPMGPGNLLAPQQVEQHVGVSTLYPPKPNPQVRSLTGSASASAKSGDSASANTGSANSAASSSSSLQPRPQQAIAVPP